MHQRVGGGGGGKGEIGGPRVTPNASQGCDCTTLHFGAACGGFHVFLALLEVFIGHRELPRCSIVVTHHIGTHILHAHMRMGHCIAFAKIANCDPAPLM